MLSGRTLAAVTAIALIAGAVPAAAHRGSPDTGTGPSTTTDPYVLPVAPGVTVRSLLTVDDDGSASNGYELTGIPDGLGVTRGGGRNFTLFMNHELRDAQGGVHRHGQKGAYVSTFSIDRRTFEVEEGSDTIDPGVRYWNYVTQEYQATASPGGANPRNAADTFPKQLDAFSRFCSGTLSAPEQFRNQRSGRGYSGQVYFANEESGVEGRLFGVLADGATRQLPRLGLLSWENTKPAYNRTDATTAIGNEDDAAGQLWVYRGTKRGRGSAFDRAGLTNGVNSVLDLIDESVKTDAELRAKYGKGKPAEFDLGEVDWDQSGARQHAEAAADGISFNRIEDGTWDPEHPNTYYFLTTEGGDTTPHEPGVSRDGGGLWKVTFEDIEHPELGGTIELALDGSEAPQQAGQRRHRSRRQPADPGGPRRQRARRAHRGVRHGERRPRGGRRVRPEPVRRWQPEPHHDRRGVQRDRRRRQRPRTGLVPVRRAGPQGQPQPDNVELGQLMTMHVDRFRRVYDIE